MAKKKVDPIEEDLCKKYGVPREFKSFGSTIVTVFDSNDMNRKDQLGEYMHHQYKIILSEKDNNIMLPVDQIRDTYYHELAHQLFNASGREDLSQNETLVETMGKLIRQFIESAKF